MIDFESALRRLACICALAVLSACGGGGGDNSDTPAAKAVDSSTGATSSTGSDGSASTAPGAMHSGEGTYYAATGAGACSFDPGADLMVAAINHTDYAGSAACGAFITVTGPRGSVTVRITDECPECAPGDVDLSAEAFALIADPVAGRVPITWQVVAGNASGPVQYRYKEGSTRYWTAIQVRNHRVPIARLQIQPAGSSGWIEVQRTQYNYFVHPTTISAGALQVRIIANTGATLQDTLAEPLGGVLVAGSGQFP